LESSGRALGELSEALECFGGALGGLESSGAVGEEGNGRLWGSGRALGGSG